MEQVAAASLTLNDKLKLIALVLTWNQCALIKFHRIQY